MPDHQETASLVFLILAGPLAFFIAWSDLRTMKIPTWSTDLLLGIFAVAGLFVLPFDVWAWRWLNFVVVFLIAIILFYTVRFGAGDGKYAASMAPFIDPAHVIVVVYLYSAFLLAAFFTHRAMRAVPSVRRMTPEWTSWTRKDFPMGLAISGTFLSYLFFTAFPAAYDALMFDFFPAVYEAIFRRSM
ncbi:A24 family peptidase [Ostreiculturibacter nitratireducens]|uniref:A24 family peptidase n=1 Tax=Ostreiculturibacter nitratireducens TaxID=3075226 RepID=UPI0031B57F33